MTGVRPRLSIIIVSYNTQAITLACLESLYRFPPPISFEVLIVDNASPDGSAQAIAAAFPQATLIASADNLGFAAGNNLAAEQAAGERILLLNPDTVVHEHTFAGVWAFAEREPQRGIWGGRTLFGDGSLNPTSCWHRISVWSLFCNAVGLSRVFQSSEFFNPEPYGRWQRDSIREVDIVTGCFLLIDASLWRELGGFDPTFFMYAEEADLCLRARKLGARPAVTPDAELVHLGGASERSRTEALIKIMRGRATLLRKHWSPTRLAAGQAMMTLWAGLRVFLSRWVSGRHDDPDTAHQKWKEVWARRSEWLDGYPDRPHDRTSGEKWGARQKLPTHPPASA